MRFMRILAVALGAIVALALTGDVKAGGNPGNPAPAGKAKATGPSIELVGMVEDDIPDQGNEAGTYSSIDEFKGLADMTIAGIAINVKPGGNPEAHLLVSCEMKTIPAKKDKKGRVIEAAKKVPDATRPVLKGYVPQDAVGGDDHQYTTFNYASEAKKDVDEGSIKGMVTAQPSGGIMIRANGTPLGIVQLLKDKSGVLELKIYHLKVKVEEKPVAEELKE